MLDKLVVSKSSTKENRRIGNFIVTSFLAMVSVLTVGLVYSLFSYNLAMGSENLNVSTLVAPVLETEAKPEPPKEEIKPEKAVSQNTSKIPERKTNTLRMEESPVKVPDKVSVTKSDVLARPKGIFTTSNVDTQVSTTTNSGVNRNTTGSPNTSSIIEKSNETPKVIEKKSEVAPPPVLKKEPEPPIEKKPITVSKGVVNGKAINLVTPAYSQAAKSMNVSGKVTVQVLIDEDGNVVSANAASGHPLLRQSAVSAARSSKFSPTFLSGQKVKVSGMIVYNFVK